MNRRPGVIAGVALMVAGLGLVTLGRIVDRRYDERDAAQERALAALATPAPTATAAARPDDVGGSGLTDCKPCPGDRSGRLLCCVQSITLDDASLRLLNQAFNFAGQLGEHDRLLTETSQRFAFYDRRFADYDARLGLLERELREVGLTARELERQHRGRR